MKWLEHSHPEPAHQEEQRREEDAVWHVARAWYSPAWLISIMENGPCYPLSSPPPLLNMLRHCSKHHVLAYPLLRLCLLVLQRQWPATTAGAKWLITECKRPTPGHAFPNVCLCIYMRAHINVLAGR